VVTNVKQKQQWFVVVFTPDRLPRLRSAALPGPYLPRLYHRTGLGLSLPSVAS
jgi:hypothetical protein